MLSASACAQLYSPQSKLIFQHLLSLAKFDANYELRDKARFLHHLQQCDTKLFSRIVTDAKPPPSTSLPRSNAHASPFILASLSHFSRGSYQHFDDLLPPFCEMPVQLPMDAQSSPIVRPSWWNTSVPALHQLTSAHAKDDTHSISESDFDSDIASESESQSDDEKTVLVGSTSSETHSPTHLTS